MSSMDSVNLVLIFVGSICLCYAHGVCTGLGLGLLAFALMPHYGKR